MWRRVVRVQGGLRERECEGGVRMRARAARDGAPLHADEITSSTVASLEVVIVGESSPTTAI
jgi:hypothetical protein